MNSVRQLKKLITAIIKNCFCDWLLIQNYNFVISTEILIALGAIKCHLSIPHYQKRMDESPLNTTCI